MAIDEILQAKKEIEELKLQMNSISKRLNDVEKNDEIKQLLIELLQKNIDKIDNNIINIEKNMKSGLKEISDKVDIINNQPNKLLETLKNAAMTAIGSAFGAAIIYFFVNNIK